MTKNEAMRRTMQDDTLRGLGFTLDEADKLRRISNTLHRWYELECGTDNGCIERDEVTDKAYWLNSTNMRRYPVADRERGAIKRLDAIMANHAPLAYYLQTDCRGAALYLLRAGDVPAGKDAGAYYNRGICVY